MKKKLCLLLTCALSATILFGCGQSGAATASKNDEKIVMVWYPNESGGDLEEARNAMGDIVAEATGKEVEHKLTTDYAIALEALANGKAHIAFTGPQGYIEANQKNKSVQPLFVPSGVSGTLDDAVYYAWLAVNSSDADEYKNGDSYSIDNIEGKKMSYVSNSSTSGFKVPSSSIVSYFSKEDKWKDLDAEGLMEGGNDKFFSEVLFGGSHQGSAVNLLTNKADVAAMCDEVLVKYVDLVSGEMNGVGSTYKVKDNADEPFNTVQDGEFTIIASTPVLNSPFSINTEVLSGEDADAILKAMTSDEVANNEAIFAPADSEKKSFFAKKGDERFLPVEDAWFDPIRKLSN